MIPGPGRQIPIWAGGFSQKAFERGVVLGDGFIFAGEFDSVGAHVDFFAEFAELTRDI